MSVPSPGSSALVRGHLAWGWDDNVREAMDPNLRLEDRFLRLLLEVAPRQLETGAYRVWGRGRGLTERYDRYATESRFQGEATLGLARRVRRRGTVWLTGRFEGRSYPDSIERNYLRSAVAFGLGSAIRSGQISLSGAVRGIDYRRTSWFDQRSRAFTADYRRRLSERLDLRFLAEFEWSRYGRPAIKQVEADVFELVGEQKDRGRLARIELRYLRRLFFELGTTWETVRSNSFGFSVGRKGLEAAVSGWLPGKLLLQVRGRVESVSYHDRDLDRVFVIRTGEDQEAGEDNNRLLVRLQRSIGRTVSLEGRVSWFRNESLLIGEYYRKTVGSVGITWTPVGASDF